MRFLVYRDSEPWRFFVVWGVTIGMCRLLRRLGERRRGWDEQQCRSERV